MSRRKIAEKIESDILQAKKLSPRKWAATKSLTSAEIVWQHVVADKQAKQNKPLKENKIENAGQ